MPKRMDYRIRDIRWERVRQAAYERDLKRDARCWICKEAGLPDEECKIDYFAKPGTPNAWEPDHFKEVSKHPELQLDITNIRPSHSYCNRARGIRFKAKRRWKEELGEPSRKWF